MIKTTQISELLGEWKMQFPFEESDFYADGIINEELYMQSPPGKKLLFLTKEPNAINHEKNSDRSFVTEWNTMVPEYFFAIRIAEWAYGIHHDFPPFDGIPKNRHEYLKRIAFMNVKKSGGKGLAINKTIAETTREQLDNIRKEIDIIEPDIIITGLSEEKIRQILWKDIAWKDSGYTCKIGRHENTKIIDFYHPSCRAPAAATYSLLQNIVRSDAFNRI